ncbi:MAG: hypothetical protein Kow0092_14430 [Deferrisomatales bacterium]
MERLSLAPTVGPAPGQSLPRDLEGACRALEREFAALVFQKMRTAMVPSPRTGGSAFARETAESLLDAQWAELASRGEGLGLWRAMYRQLSEVKSPPEATDQRSRGSAVRREAAADGTETETHPNGPKPPEQAPLAHAALGTSRIEVPEGSPTVGDGPGRNPRFDEDPTTTRRAPARGGPGLPPGSGGADR